VKVEVSGNDLQFSAAPAAGPTMGPVIWTVPVGTVTKTLDEFIALVGVTDVNQFLKVRNLGPSVGHYKITFTHIEA
jgi:hypothetical protein